MAWLSAGIKCCSLLWQPWRSQLCVLGTNKCHYRWGHWQSPGTHRWQLPKHARQEAYVLWRTAGIVWRIYTLENYTSWLNPVYCSWCSDFITGWSIQSLFPVRERQISSSWKCPDSLWSSPSIILFPLEVKQPGCETDHWCTSSSEVTNEWCFASIPRIHSTWQKTWFLWQVIFV